MEADVSEDLKPNEATQETAVSRREFGAVSLAAGLAVVAGAGAAEAAERPLTETEVTVKTPDGNCDAVFIHPTTGIFPGVLIWPDAFGLRPAMRQIGRRIASEGYAVLVPNPFYRTAKAPVFDNPAAFDFSNPADTAKLPPLTGPLQAAGAAEKDALAYVAFLDAHKEVDRTKKIGTQGYCMGGALVVRTVAVATDRIGAGASFHGGGLVTDNPNRPPSAGAQDQGADVFRDCRE
jgi:carboxymethylenebutenolidase